MPKSPLSVGAVGDNVVELQKILSQNGFQVPLSEVNRAFFGPGTRQAVMKFQQQYDLPVSGVVDKNTAAAMTTVMANMPDPQATATPSGSDLESALSSDDSSSDSPATNAIASLTPAPTETNLSDLLGLKLGDCGALVGLLHDNLHAAGFSIAEEDKQQSEFGASTLTALHGLLARHGLPEKTEIDAEILKILFKNEENITINIYQSGSAPTQTSTQTQGTVNGQLVDEDGAPLAAVPLALISQQLRQSTQLQTGQTDVNGQYSMQYARPAALNLQVQAYAGDGSVLAESPINYAAPANVEIDLTTAADGVVRSPSVYTTLSAQVAVQLQGTPLEDLVENSTTHEITFLAKSLGVQFSQLAFLYIARLLGLNNGLNDQTLFGLFSQGVPASLNSALSNLPSAGIDSAFTAQILSGVLLQNRAALDKVLSSALSANVLPASFSNSQQSELDILDTLREASVGAAPYVRGKTALNDLLAAGAVPQNVQTAFIKQFAANTGNLTQTWQVLQSDTTLKPADLTHLQTVLNSGELLSGNLPLVNDTLNRLNNNALADLRDLALLDQSDWQARIQQLDPQANSIPSVLVNETAAQKIARLALTLTKRFNARYPTTAFLGGLKKNSQSKFQKKDDIAAFLSEQTDFSLHASNIDQYLFNNKLTLDKDTLAELKTAQRLHRLSPVYASVETLIGANYISAQHIYFKGRDAFLAEMTPALGSAALAAMAYARAQMTYATALAVFGNFNLTITGHGPVSLPFTAPPPETIAQWPDLQALFGSLDYFQCSDCQSVYSPAAYLVDLLQYLRNFTAYLLVTSVTIPTGAPANTVVIGSMFQHGLTSGETIVIATGPGSAQSWGPFPITVISPMFFSIVDPSGSINTANWTGEWIILNSQSTGTTTALQVLLDRRPDIQYIALDCSNTNTTLPYIDLVNEILEAAVAPLSATNTLNPLATTYNGPVYIDTTGSSAERRALPQQIQTNVSNAAYSQTNSVVFPLSLPFDVNFAKTSAYLSALGSSLYSILALFPKNATADVLSAAYLNINPAMLAIIETVEYSATTTNAAPASARWGLLPTNNTSVIDPKTNAPYTTPGMVNCDWVTALNKVPVLLNRSGLSLQQLYQLLEVQWVTQKNVKLWLGTDTVTGDQVVSPDTDKMTFTDPSGSQPTTLNGSVLDSANRFLRLWNACGLQMWELDWALEHAAGGTLDGNFLVFLAGAMRVQKLLNLPFQEVLTFWAFYEKVRFRIGVIPGGSISWLGNIETRDVTSHLGDEDTVIPATYTEVFANPTIMVTWSNLFDLSNNSSAIKSSPPLQIVFPASSNSSQQTNLNPLNGIVAALGISPNDISAILADKDALNSGATNTLTLSTLTVLFCYARLAKALSLSVSDLILWKALTEVTPFGVKHSGNPPTLTLTQPADTLKFLRRLAMLQATNFAVHDLDYLLRGQSAAQTALAFTDAQAAAVLQAIHDALAKLLPVTPLTLSGASFGQTVLIAAASYTPLSIIAATNTSPITITTATPHNLQTGNQVTISGVQGNTAANGVFVIATSSGNPNEFSLNTGGNGTYSSGGTVAAPTAPSFTPLNIVSATNTTPITITTVTPHNLQTGAQVTISGVQGNTAANGVFTITASSGNPSEFSLNSGGNGSYTSGGTAVPNIVITTVSPHNLQTGAQVAISGVQGNNAANGVFTITASSGNSNEFSLNNSAGNAPSSPGGMAVAVNVSAPNISVAGAASLPTLTISSVSGANSSPITITTTANHNLQTGMQVTISGVQGNTAANGVFTITAAASPLNQFSLNNTTGNGAYTTGGAVQPPLDIIITTQAPHWLQTGMQVMVSGVLGNTAANGVFTITYINTINANQFSLNNTASNGTYSGGGTVTPNLVITTATPHGLIYGDPSGNPVTISGVQSNTAANGSFFTTVLSPATLILNNAAGNGMYAGGGVLVANNALLATNSTGNGLATQIQTIVVQALAAAVNTPADAVVTTVLLKAIPNVFTDILDPNGTGPFSASGIALFLTQVSAVDPSQFPQLTAAFTAIAKAAAFYTGLQMTNGEFVFLVQNASIFNWLDLGNLPVTPIVSSNYPAFQALLRALKLNRRQPARTPKLFDVLGYWLQLPANLAFPTDIQATILGLDTPPNLVITSITNSAPIVITTESPHNLETGMLVTVNGVQGNTAANGTFIIHKINLSTFSLIGSIGNGDYSSNSTNAITVSVTPTLAQALNATADDALAIAQQLGAQPPTLNSSQITGTLCDMKMLTKMANALDVAARYRLGGAVLVSLANPTPTSDTAAAAFGAFQAQYPQNSWFAAVQTVEDNLRQIRRDALAAYLLGNPPVSAPPRPLFLTTDDIYNYYLIDPEMCSCALTTRLLQPSLAIQQFVQQAFLNLNIAAQIDTTNSLWSEWSWRQQFRLWQANREVFLYPENYLLPELRTNASSFFTDLENDLRQTNCDANAAEAAFENYMRKLVSVSRLKVAAHYNQTNAGPNRNDTVLHVFARTHGSPAQWYYRTRTTQPPVDGQVIHGIWTPWTQLNLDITADHLLPVLWDQRLHLLWPNFKKISEQLGSQTIPANAGTVRTSSPPPQTFWAIEFAMSELSAGQWQAKKTITNKFYLPDFCPANSSNNSKGGGTTSGSGSGKGAGTTGGSVIGSGPTSPPQTGGGPVRSTKEIRRTESQPFSLPPLGFTFTAKQDDNFQLQIGVYLQASYNGLEENNDVDYTNDLHYFTPSNVPTLAAGGTLVAPDSPLIVFESLDYYPWTPIDFSQEPSFALVVNSYDGFNVIAKSYWANLNNIDIVNTVNLLQPSTFGYSGQDLVSGSYLTPNPGSVALNVQSQNASNSSVLQPIGLLGSIFNPRIVIPQNEDTFDSLDPFFVDDSTRVYLVDPIYFSTLNSSQQIDIVATTTIPSQVMQWATKYQFETFYHPFARTFVRELEIGGIPKLMSRNLQTDPQSVRNWGSNLDFNFYNIYTPNHLYVQQPFPGVSTRPFDPGETYLDFDSACGGAYSEYNWEIFYHAPMFVAGLLLQNQQYQDALTWLEYIFNPTDNSGGPAPQRFWQMAPLNATSPDWSDEAIQNLMTNLAAYQQQGGSNSSNSQTATSYIASANAILAWQQDPYDPDLIARTRIATYAKATVMKFLDTLLAWGDSLYAQYTAEMVSQAEQLYIMADMLLGPKPDQVRLPSQPGMAQTYASLQNIDPFSNVLLPIENLVIAPEPPQNLVQGTAETVTLPQFPGTGTDVYSLLFCIPPNQQLLAYWNQVAQRIYNIRHCLNLQGVAQPLPLYAPPINPMALVAAQASGAGATGGMASAPIYRFATYLQKAVELVNDVRSYGSTILAALEKQDAEALAVLHANQELDIQTRMLDVKTQQVTEAQDQITALQNQLAVTQIRYNFYSSIEPYSPWEITALSLQGAAMISNGIAVISEFFASGAAITPKYTLGVSGMGGTPAATATFGGENIANSSSKFASATRGLAGILSESGQIAGSMGSYQRRNDEWTLQKNLANAELTQISSQITAATDRWNIAKSELDIQTAQVNNAQTVSDFLTNKFTSVQLYNWMTSQLTTVYTQAYQITFGMALQAQAAYQYELGRPTDQFISFAYWNSQQKGLTAGDSLLFDLRRMEAQYLANNLRELELTKHISLALTQPLALVTLLQSGSCSINLDESVFDADHPGQYFRRLRSVAVTIPCVTGPYTGVNATLTLGGTIVRTAPPAAGFQPWQWANASSNTDAGVSSVPYQAGAQTIATSSGQNDAGLFEANLRDERWLPFEGQGAVSQWLLTLDPRDNNFDLSTVTDVIMHIRYTARTGGDAEAVRKALIPQGPRQVLISVRHTFCNQYYAFFNPNSGATAQNLVLPLTANVLPYANLGKPSITDLSVYLLFNQSEVPPGGGIMQSPPPASFGLSITASSPSNIFVSMSANQTTQIGVLWADAGLSSAVAPSSFTLSIPYDSGNPVLSENLIDDIVLLVSYDFGGNA